MQRQVRFWSTTLLIAWALVASWYAYVTYQRAARLETLRSAESDRSAELRAELAHWRELVTGDRASRLTDVRQRLQQLVQEELLDAPSVSLDEPVLGLTERLVERVAALRAELQTLRARLRDAELAAASAGAPPNTAVEAYVEELHQERLEEQQKMLSLLQRREQQIQSLADRVQSLARQLQEARHDRAQLEATMLREVDRLKTALEELRKYRPKPVGVVRLEPDGQVVRANNARKLVWINVGSREGVQPGMSFSVWSATASVALDRPKATIVVSRVIDRSLSEARIVQADPRHPVVDGDQICNAAWDRNRPTAFVLAGIIDLDADGTDDRAIVLRAIRRSGGTVIAELLPDGTVRGEIRAEVRFFVRGKAEGGLKELCDQLENEARDFGAYVLTVPKLADLLGLPRVRRHKP